MVKPVSTLRPVDVLRMSSDQIRRAAQILAEITDDTAGPAGRFSAFSNELTPRASDREADREATISSAQRSFAAELRLSHSESDPHQ